MKKQIETKRCSRCGEVKGLDGFRKGRNTCKECEAERKKKHYEENKDKILDKRKQYRGDNKEKISVSSKRYREANSSKIKEREKKYRKKNRNFE